MMTIGWWIGAGVIGVIGIVVTIAVGYCAWENGDSVFLRCLVAILITAVLFGGTIGAGAWYCKCTADGARAMKDQESNLNNGLHREIIVTAEDGREMGKVRKTDSISHLSNIDFLFTKQTGSLFKAYVSNELTG